MYHLGQGSFVFEFQIAVCILRKVKLMEKLYPSESFIWREYVDDCLNPEDPQ